MWLAGCTSAVSPSHTGSTFDLSVTSSVSRSSSSFLASSSSGSLASSGSGPSGNQSGLSPQQLAARTPRVVSRTLKNGVQVVIWRDDEAPVVALRATWRGGLLAEDGAPGGVTQVLARVMTRGCGGRGADAIDQLLAERGGAMRGVSGRDSFGLRAEWPAGSWQLGLELLSQCIVAPDLAWAAILDQRRRMIDEIVARDESLGALALRTFSETRYPAHPYRSSPLGTGDSLAAIDRRVVTRYYRTRYPISGLTLAVVGAVEPDAAIAVIERSLGSVPGAPAAPAARSERLDGQGSGLPVDPDSERRPGSGREVHRFRASAVIGDRARLVIGFPGAAMRTPDRHALALAAMILESRLQRDLDRRGVARTEVHTVTAIEPGYVVVGLACRPDQLAEGHAKARAEIVGMAAAPVTAGELERARAVLLAAHRRTASRPASLAAGLAFHHAHGLGVDGYLAQAIAIRRVTPDDVMAAVLSYLPWDRAIVATVAPMAATPEAARRIRGIRKRLPRDRSRRRSSKAGRR